MKGTTFPSNPSFSKGKGQRGTVGSLYKALNCA